MHNRYQVLYDRPYNPAYIFILIAILTIAFISIHIEFAVHMPSLLPVSFGLHWGLICGICLLAILFDPSVAYLTTKRDVSGNGGGGGGDGSARVVTVRRPLVAFRESRVNVLLENTEGVAGWNWIDGVRYEEAAVEV
ncbi:hypothetical protein SI65_02442 [Aspergillus cristatus]|uniref:Uncharacterized protein n=1 Tax=Aspergillus cristatus TaxID=573508 RepID=A0A1E3BL15_ASPCR|nr:hypothetical protein SI65_02442 [Aspergillus cristatus]